MVEFRGKNVGDQRLTDYLKMHRPRRIAFYNTLVSDAGLAQLVNCDRLEEVLIYSGEVGDLGFRTLCNLPRITSILLYDCPNITDSVVRHLAAATWLHELCLCGTRISNDAMEIVGTNSTIWSLGLDDTNIDDNGIELLSPMLQLGILSMNRCSVTGIGLRRFKPSGTIDFYLKGSKVTDESLKIMCSNELPVKTLDLSDTAITDIGLQSLAGITQLNSLRLNNTAVTDNGIMFLAGLPVLEGLELSGTKVTEAGIAVLKRENRRILFY